jgi:2-pyrone-4,6-dicarboxylate lactonase
MKRRDTLGGLAGIAALAALGPLGARAAETAPPAIPGPDPHPGTPKFKVPAGTIDTHCHIFGPAARYPFAASRPYTPPDEPLAAFRAVHATIGVRRAVIVTPTIYGTDNRVTLDAIAKSEGRYKGIAIVDDGMSDQELDALNKGGMRGCRFAFLKRLGGVGDLGAFTRIVRRVAALGWHIDVYLEPGTVADYAALLSGLPAKYIIDHMGTVEAAKGLDDPGFTALRDLQKRDPKCWVKITGLERASASGPPFHDALPFARALIDNAPDRVIWGTDWPHPNVKFMPNDGDIVDLIPLYAPDRVKRHKLLVDNPARLFGFVP